MKKFVLYFYLFITSVFILLSSGTIDSQDGIQYLTVARNLYYTGEPTAPVYEFDQGKNIHMSTFVGKNGKTYSPTGLGYSLALVPSVFFTDLIYKLYSIPALQHFPLESDWLILLFASFTNSFLAGGLAITLFLYLVELKLAKKHALLITLLGMLTTNLLVLSKHSFAHMMFTFFLLLSFFLLKIYSSQKKPILLIASGISFGIMSITYNQTFVLAILPYLLYYFLLIKSKTILITIKDALFFLIGVAPFALTYLWFENLRATGSANFASVSYLSSTTKSFFSVPIGVFFEGIWGQLFSPGRSFFIYSPIILIIILFWHKIKSKIIPELAVFLSLFVIYVLFFASQYSLGAPDQGVAAYWHGESSWGPRYLTPIIPFGLIIVGYLFTKISKLNKIFFFYPLAILGLFVELLGVILPYQIKLHELEHHFFVNSTEFTASYYSNLIPRFSPLFMMSKKLGKLIQTFPTTLDHGPHRVRFVDGIDFTFSVGPERWRVVDGKGFIYFDNIKTNPVEKISFGLINHPIKEASNSAILQFTLNNKILAKNTQVLKIAERKLIEIPIDKSMLQEKDNLLIIDVDYQAPQKIAEKIVLPKNRNLSLLGSKQQILGIISMSINNQNVNLESIDFPFVSGLGPTMMGITYGTYGGPGQDPWLPWYIHTQIYERTPDFWWIKPLFYWDYPKKLFAGLLGINLVGLCYFGLKMTQNYKKIK